jgi:hypothetical protein
VSSVSSPNWNVCCCCVVTPAMAYKLMKSLKKEDRDEAIVPLVLVNARAGRSNFPPSRLICRLPRRIHVEERGRRQATAHRPDLAEEGHARALGWARAADYYFCRARVQGGDGGGGRVWTRGRGRGRLGRGWGGGRGFLQNALRGLFVKATHYQIFSSSRRNKV